MASLTETLVVKIDLDPEAKQLLERLSTELSRLDRMLAELNETKDRLDAVLRRAGMEPR